SGGSSWSCSRRLSLGSHGWRFFEIPMSGVPCSTTTKRRGSPFAAARASLICQREAREPPRRASSDDATATTCRAVRRQLSATSLLVGHAASRTARLQPLGLGRWICRGVAGSPLRGVAPLRGPPAPYVVSRRTAPRSCRDALGHSL